MRLGYITESLTIRTLDEITRLREYGGDGLVVSFQSNGFIDGASKPRPTFNLVDFGNSRYVIDVLPPWILELKSKVDIPDDKHFVITIKTSNPGGFEWYIVAEKLEYLERCDIYRDGGSYGATWITNYGNKWELWLEVDRSNDDHQIIHNYLYNCNHSDIGLHMPVLKGSEADVIINKKLDEWLNDIPPQGKQKNKDLMESNSRLNEMRYSMQKRQY